MEFEMLFNGFFEGLLLSVGKRVSSMLRTFYLIQEIFKTGWFFSHISIDDIISNFYVFVSLFSEN